MIGDDRQSEGRVAQRPDPREDEALHELIEALTALGIYVAVAARMSESAGPTGTEIGKVLEKTSGQQARASMALRRLRERLMR